LITKLRPAVSKYWLIGIAGVLWSIVGIALCRFAYEWLVGWNGAIVGVALGAVLATVAYRLSFLRIARRNIRRLFAFQDKVCLFAFQAWRSYIIIAVMITLGILLRRSRIPHSYLAVLYIAIGGALLLSSLSYYSCLWRTLVQGSNCLPPEEDDR